MGLADDLIKFLGGIAETGEDVLTQGAHGTGPRVGPGKRVRTGDVYRFLAELGGEMSGAPGVQRFYDDPGPWTGAMAAAGIPGMGTFGSLSAAGKAARLRALRARGFRIDEEMINAYTDTEKLTRADGSFLPLVNRKGQPASKEDMEAMRFLARQRTVKGDPTTRKVYMEEDAKELYSAPDWELAGPFAARRPGLTTSTGYTSFARSPFRHHGDVRERMLVEGDRDMYERASREFPRPARWPANKGKSPEQVGKDMNRGYQTGPGGGSVEWHVYDPQDDIPARVGIGGYGGGGRYVDESVGATAHTAQQRKGLTRALRLMGRSGIRIGDPANDPIADQAARRLTTRYRSGSSAERFTPLPHHPASRRRSDSVWTSSKGRQVLHEFDRIAGLSDSQVTRELFGVGEAGLKRGMRTSSGFMERVAQSRSVKPLGSTPSRSAKIIKEMFGSKHSKRINTMRT